MTHPIASNESTLGLRPNPRYQHGFAIIRIDEYSDPEIPIEDRITVKKIVHSAEEAEREVERLNRLRAGKRGRYFSQLTRLEPEDQAQGTTELVHTNRISALMPEPTADVIRPEKRARLETIFVPEFIQRPPPEDWGFPAFRACEVCAEPDMRHLITWYEFHACIYRKNGDGFADIVGAHESAESKTVFFAFRVFPDLSQDSIYDLDPLKIVVLMANRLGLTMTAGSNSGKFFLREEFPVPTIFVPGAQPGQPITVTPPEGHSFIPTWFVSPTPSLIRIPLGFCIDTTEYLRWAGNR